MAWARIRRSRDVMAKKIGIIGHGKIGSYIVSKARQEKGLHVGFVYDADPQRLTGVDSSLVVRSLEEARDRAPDLVVETASGEWVRECAPIILTFSDLLIVSVAAFAEEGLRERLDSVARDNRTRYYVSHGAILGLDGVRDGREMIDEVRITTLRPQEGYGLKEKLSEKTVLYDGPTRKACQLYPRNVNIHASLALHGLGFDRTHSTVIADPEAKKMRHIIEVKGRGFAWKIEVEATPLGERTGAYAPESVFQTVKRICTEEYGMNLI
jgi:aspartate dehydrogenase